MSIEHDEAYLDERLTGYSYNENLRMRRCAKEYAEHCCAGWDQRITELEAENERLEAALADVHDKHWFLQESIAGGTPQFKIPPSSEIKPK